MKNIYMMLFLLTALGSCGQNKKDKNTDEMQTALIEKYTEKIWSEIQQYEVQPAYYLRLYQANCTFQVSVNGLEIFRNHKLDKLGSALILNNFILKSGKQEVTVRMYPLGTLLQDEYEDESYGDILTLLPESNVEVKVTNIKDLKTYSSPSKDEKVVMLTNSPKDEKGEFIGKGLPYYEYSFTFEAEVPYAFDGWSNGVDLSTVDQRELKEKFLEVNNQFREMYLNKDGEGIMLLMEKRLIRDAETKYTEKKDLESQLRTIFDDIYEDKISYKIEDRNLVISISFQNKLITQRVTNDLIKSRTLEFIDDRGSSNIILINSNDIGNSLNAYFYMPKEYEGKEIHLEYIP